MNRTVWQMQWIVLVFAMLFPPCAIHAKTTDASFFFDHERGWFWYERPPKQEKRQREESYAFPPKTIEEARRQLKSLKERAVMHPTDRNMVAYIRLQNWVNDKSDAFANAWQRVLWTHPGLDYSIDHPIDGRALLIRREEKDAHYRQRLNEIAGRYGMIFVFRSTCPYCHAEAPMLRHFAAKHGFSVIPVSQDGIGLPDYPRPEMDHGISSQFGVQSVPALFLVNPRRREVFPVAFGMVSESELARRIVSIVNAREDGGGK